MNETTQNCQSAKQNVPQPEPAAPAAPTAAIQVRTDLRAGECVQRGNVRVCR